MFLNSRFFVKLNIPSFDFFTSAGGGAALYVFLHIPTIPAPKTIKILKLFFTSSVCLSFVLKKMPKPVFELENKAYQFLLIGQLDEMVNVKRNYSEHF